MENLRGKFKREVLSDENIVLRKNDKFLGGKGMKARFLAVMVCMMAVVNFVSTVNASTSTQLFFDDFTGTVLDTSLWSVFVDGNGQSHKPYVAGGLLHSQGYHTRIDSISTFAPMDQSVIARARIRLAGEVNKFGFAPNPNERPGPITGYYFETNHLNTSPFGREHYVHAVAWFQPASGSFDVLLDVEIPVTWYEFHEFAIVRTPSEVIYSIDGQEVARVEDAFEGALPVGVWNDRWSLMQTDWVEVSRSEPECPPMPSHEPWSFVQMTDLHIGKSRADDILLDAVDKLNNMSQKPDFVLVTGDIVDSAWIQIDDIRFPREAFGRYVEIMSQLDNEIEHYEVPGNHDRYVYGYDDFDFFFDDSWYIFNSLDLSQYCAWLPGWIDGGHYYSFEHKGLMFVGLDSGQDTEEGTWYPNNGKYHRGTGLTNPQMNWLRGLDQCSPKVVFMHHPTINSPLDEWTISQNQWNFIDYCKNKGNNVKLVLAGHTHNDIIFDRIGSVVSNESTNYPLFTQTPAMCDGFYRKFNVSSPPKPEQTSFVSYRSKITTSLYSHSNVHVFDSIGRHVGISTLGNIERGIPESYYLSGSAVDTENQNVTIFPEKIVIYEPTDNYFFEVDGYKNGTYKLDITFQNNGEEKKFHSHPIGNQL